MIISNIIGGLGNQMFQYATGKAIAIRSRQKLKLDTTSFEHYKLRSYELDVFNIDTELASIEEINHLKYNEPSIIEKIKIILRKRSLPLKNRYYKEKDFHFDPEILNLKESIYLDGYWQSEKYFIAYKDILIKEFTPKKEISHQSNLFLRMMQATVSVSIHIRRGDYVSNPTTNSFHGTCDLDYYKNAVSFITNKIDHPHFFIFSDDLIWAKEHLDFIDNITFIELDEYVPDHEEMYLMSLCKHNIIGNSSFSWWGAWLNQNSNKIIISPKKWFNDQTINTNDLIPNSWIRL